MFQFFAGKSERHHHDAIDGTSQYDFAKMFFFLIRVVAVGNEHFVIMFVGDILNSTRQGMVKRIRVVEKPGTRKEERENESR